MQSRTSFCNKTVYKKNLTRFAPVWGVYTLCLIVGIVLMYSNGGTMKQFHFARNMAQLVEVMAVVNLGYALVVAQLLFGDLYNSRMCNALHALPLRRECWFVTNILSGLTFSLVPTAVMALVAMPLLAGSIFEGAVSISWWVFLASNLQFICFFGLAVFAAMCVGNRFTMVAGYGLLNAGAFIAYWLIDTVYTPMLYGVITPTELVNNLTPMSHMTNNPYIKTEVSLYDLRQQFGDKLEGAVASFTITDNWWRLWVLAAVGIGFLILALVLYRKRDLECAGDAVAFRLLVPVFQVLCSLFVTTGAQFFLSNFLGLGGRSYLVLSAGLVVGWFVGKMLIERNTRVFRLQNWYGLAALAAVCAVSLWLTHVDILNIETRMPDAHKIKTVYFESATAVKYTDPEDIEAMLALQEDALLNRADNYGTYVLGTNGEWVYYIDTNADIIDEENENNQYRYVANVALRYELQNGKLIRRHYNIWVDTKAGEIAERYLTDWEAVNGRTVTIDGVEYDRLDLVMEEVKDLYVSYAKEEDLKKACTPGNIRSLIRAIQADCEEGNMAQNPYFHGGHFRLEDEEAEKGYYNMQEFQIDISSEKYTWWVSVYPDSANTLHWLEENGLLNMEVRSENINLG